ncbi:MAG: ATP-binding protein [Chloroflexota bacterium]
MDIQIPQHENQYIEFKSEATKAADLADEIIAFANGEGGEIWLGFEDDGTVHSLNKSREDLQPSKPIYLSHLQLLVPNGSTARTTLTLSGVNCWPMLVSIATILSADPQSGFSSSQTGWK